MAVTVSFNPTVSTAAPVTYDAANYFDIENQTLYLYSKPDIVVAAYAAGTWTNAVIS